MSFYTVQLLITYIISLLTLGSTVICYGISLILDCTNTLSELLLHSVIQRSFPEPFSEVMVPVLRYTFAFAVTGPRVSCTCTLAEEQG